MWFPDLPKGYHARKCRHRVASLCRGTGLDLQPQGEKIVKNAIGIGSSSLCSINLDLSATHGLYLFADNSMDYVFAADLICRFRSTRAILQEWWRVIRPGGYLILYEPDPDYIGDTSGRKRELYWQDVWQILKSFGNARKISAERYKDGVEFHWQLVVQKKWGAVKTILDWLKPRDNKGKVAFPITKRKKSALVIRYGALGDTLWITPVLSQLKKEGYHVTVNTTEYAAQVLAENPNIDEFIIHDTSTDVPYLQLEEYWQDIAPYFDRVINLTKSIEGALIKVQGSEEFDWPHEKRHKECNINFQDRTMEVAGYPELKGQLPELYFSDYEEEVGRLFRQKHRGQFIVIWALSGSAYHKVWPWAEYTAKQFLTTHKDAVIYTVGDEACRQLEWLTERTIPKSGVWSVRNTYLAVKYADLVIGPDTGTLNAASCFDVPKIVFMSANAVENLTKYWKNAIALYAEDCECYPCHRLIYTKDVCPKGEISGIAAKCMEHLKPEAVLEAMERVYTRWKLKRVEELNKQKVCAFTVVDESESAWHFAQRSKRSFEYFHPNIPFYIFHTADEAKILGDRKVATKMHECFAVRPRFALHLLKHFDIVIHLDADTVVCDRLDEFLEGDYDIAASLNLPIEGWPQDYLNAGVFAVTNEEFLKRWEHEIYRIDAGPSNMPSFNKLARQYNLKIVDKKDVYYNETSRPYWDKLYCKGGKLYCNDRLVKVLHWAGGVYRTENKISSADFSQEVRLFLNKVTGTTDFTDNAGQKISQWDKEIIKSPTEKPQ